jgi:hypothetical protein
MLRPQHVDVGDAAVCVSYTQGPSNKGLELWETGEVVSMMAQAFPRRNHLRKLRDNGRGGNSSFAGSSPMRASSAANPSALRALSGNQSTVEQLWYCRHQCQRGPDNVHMSSDLSERAEWRAWTCHLHGACRHRRIVATTVARLWPPGRCSVSGRPVSFCGWSAQCRVAGSPNATFLLRT